MTQNVVTNVVTLPRKVKVESQRANMFGAHSWKRLGIQIRL